LILDAAFGFRDAERAVAQLSKRFSGARCVLATSIVVPNDSQKISLWCAARICVSLLIGLPARDARCAAEPRAEGKRFMTLLLARSRRAPASSPVASPSDEESERDDQNSDNQHPVLDHDAENVVRLNEVLQPTRPFLVQDMPFRAK
jgi:hypothetical protein